MAGQESALDKRAAALEYLRALCSKEFAEFFYEAVRDRMTSETPAVRGHFVLADAWFDDDSGWTADFIALGDSAKYGEGSWAADLPLCESGECHECGTTIRSWAKSMICPICGSPGAGS